MRLTSLSGEALRLLYREGLRRDFPESELKPLSVVEALCAAGEYDVLEARDACGRAGYALVYRRPGGNMPLLDYFAVEPERRGQGVGGALLCAVCELYAEADALIIESERPEDAPEREAAEARLRFYARAGAKRTDIAVTLFGVEFVILALPTRGKTPPEDGALAGELARVYRAMLTPEGAKRNVHLRRKRSSR